MHHDSGPESRGPKKDGRPPRFSLTAGPALDEQTLRAMWRFRLSVMQLKPAVDPTQDWDKYAAFVSKADYVALLQDDGGAVCGTGVFALVESAAWLLALLEYTFVAPGLEGNPMLVRAGLRLMIDLFRMRRGRRLFTAGAGYPVSMLLLGRYWPPLYMDGEPINDPLIEEVLGVTRARLAGAAYERGCVVMPTLPPDPPTWWFARAQRDPAFARYAALNPRWREGHGLVCVAEVQPRHALTFGAGLVRRSARQLRRWL